MGKNKAAKKSSRAAAQSENDWIAALAKQSAAIEAGPPPKAERIERRKAKKRRRQERKPAAQQTNARAATDVSEQQDAKRMNLMSQAYLQSLERTLQHCVNQLDTNSQQPFVVSDKKGKATAGGSRLNDDLLQPRRGDYGGLGLARPSLYIGLRDPSFIPKLEEEFAEHVPGFFGKQRTKAMKRQLDGNMLWRQLAEKRADDRKIDGKKLSDMAPDERVEAMIKAGMI